MADRQSRPAPPPGTPIRDSFVGMIWEDDGDGGYTAMTAGGSRLRATWEDLDGGKHGDLELLVPVPYTVHPDGTEPAVDVAARQLVEQILNPVADMMRQLAAAAGAGITAVVAEAVRRGAAAERAHPADQRWCESCGARQPADQRWCESCGARQRGGGPGA